MAEFQRKSRIEAPVGALYAWHERPGALERLLPPWESIRVLGRPEGIREGGRVVLRVRCGPVPLRWVVVHEAVQEGRQFRDRQIRGPFTLWEHTHHFEADGPNAALLRDEVIWTLPFDRIGKTLEPWVRGELERGFAFRHERTRSDLKRHLARAATGPLHIVLTGASGLIGRQLASFLSSGGHRVQRLVRRSPVGSGEIRWDPASGRVDAAALEGVDVVIHLAGEGIASGRWTESRRRALRESRLSPTRALSEALAGLERPPRVLLSASAIGIYGNRGEEPLDERGEVGRGFLPELCAGWEAATEPAQRAGIRVVHLRTGLVLSPAGGVLGRLLPVFKAGLAGPIGSGRQVMSWIALDDWIGAVHHLIHEPSVAGPVNLAAPGAVTNAEFTGRLAEVLGRPAVLRLPARLVRFAFGEMGQELLLGGARVLPRKLLESGFQFLTPELEAALRSELGLIEEE